MLAATKAGNAVKVAAAAQSEIETIGLGAPSGSELTMKDEITVANMNVIEQ